MIKPKLPIPTRLELGFDTLYLLTAVGLGIALLVTSQSNVTRLWGIMALTLATGDAFHLVPRMAAAMTGDSQRFRAAMGVGKMLTSVTMSCFYLLLWQCGLLLFSPPPDAKLWVITALVYLLAAVRVILCLLPQNRWTSDTPSHQWGVWRNIPFVIHGGIVLWLFAHYGGLAAPPLPWMWLAIFLSFACYLPVVLFAHRHPKLGMLMLPKSCAYLWIIAMGLSF